MDRDQHPILLRRVLDIARARGDELVQRVDRALRRGPRQNRPATPSYSNAYDLDNGWFIVVRQQDNLGQVVNRITLEFPNQEIILNAPESIQWKPAPTDEEIQRYAVVVGSWVASQLFNGALRP